MGGYRLEAINRDNRIVMEKLFSRNLINATKSRILTSEPKLGPAEFSRVEGMLLGVAIGDSLGVTSEGMLPRRRRGKYGIIEDYLPNRHVNNKRVGLPSDDTQLTFDTLLVILDNGYLDMEKLASIFASHRMFGIGNTVRSFLRNYKDLKCPWYLAGVESAGNGALMRISPVVIPYLKDEGNRSALCADIVLATMLTHNDPLAIGSSVAFVELLTSFLINDGVPEFSTLLSRFCSTLQEIVGEKGYKGRMRGIGESDTVSKLFREMIEYGIKNDLSIEDFSDRIGSGAYLLETVPTVLYILQKYIDDPQEAMVQAVNNTKDNDTIGAIVGSTMGALYGRRAFKTKWVSNLSGRIREKDDGTVFRLIDETRRMLTAG